MRNIKKVYKIQKKVPYSHIADCAEPFLDQGFSLGIHDMMPSELKGFINKTKGSINL